MRQGYIANFEIDGFKAFVGEELKLMGALKQHFKKITSTLAVSAIRAEMNPKEAAKAIMEDKKISSRDDFYYEVHVSCPGKTGYSKFFKSPDYLYYKEEIAEKAFKLDILSEEECKMCDWAEELDEEEADFVEEDDIFMLLDEEE